MLKKFTANCDFGGQKAPVTFYIGDPCDGSHPLAFQSRWLSKERRGSVPQDIMDSFEKLVEISKKNRASFADLCEYVIDELKSSTSLAKDAKQATAFSDKKNSTSQK